MTQPSPSEALLKARRLHESGDLARAEAAYRSILETRPRDADALHLLGVLEHQRGRAERAIELIGAAIGINPNKAFYRNSLGAAYRLVGRGDEAIDAYREAIRLRPDYLEAHANLAVSLHERGEFDEARARLEAVLRARPDHVEGLFNLANLLQGQSRPDQAIPLYRKALELAPNRPDIHNNLGNALLTLDQVDEAIASYRRALELDPEHVDALANLGTVLGQIDRIGEATECYAAVARLRPDELQWPVRIAALCPAIFASASAIDAYRRHLEDVLDAYSGRLSIESSRRVPLGCIPPFNLSHHGRSDRILNEKFAALFPRSSLECRRDIGRGIPRIGFIVTYPREGGFLRGTAGIIEHLTPGRFQPVVLASRRAMGAIREVLTKPDLEFVEIADDLPTASRQIEEARCHVLYHWQIGTDALNYFLAFARLAPVQCTSWGTHVTSGLPAVDYYLSSVLIEPPGSDRVYSEELIRLATLPTYQRAVRRPDPPASRSEFGLPADAHLYVCLQRMPKYHPDFDPWLAEILRRDPKGLIVLRRDTGGHLAGRLAERFRATMPDVADRVAWILPQDAVRYLRLLSLADVVLDPPHYGSGLTAYDIFGLGLPLVTYPGQLHVGRYALGCYRLMGIGELIADSPEHYVELALRVGTEPSFRDLCATQIMAANGVLFEDRNAVSEHERFFEAAIREACIHDK